MGITGRRGHKPAANSSQRSIPGMLFSFRPRGRPHRPFPLTLSGLPAATSLKPRPSGLIRILASPGEPQGADIASRASFIFPFFLLTYELISTTKRIFYATQAHHAHPPGTRNHEARLAARLRHRPRYL